MCAMKFQQSIGLCIENCRHIAQYVIGILSQVSVFESNSCQIKVRYALVKGVVVNKNKFETQVFCSVKSVT